MQFIFRKKWVIAGMLLFIASIFFVWLRSLDGIILFSDNNISFWKDNLFLANPYVWHNNEYGFFNPLSVINLPIQFFFKFLTLFSDVYFISAFYFYGAAIFLFLSSMYLIRNVSSSAKIIDYLIVSIFSVSAPIIASITLLQIDVAYSFAFVYLFLGYLFSCKGKDVFEFKDILILSILVPFINTYFYNTILLAITLFMYFLFFNLSYVLRNKARFLLFLLTFSLLNIFWYIVPVHQVLFSKGNLVAFYSEDLAIGVLEGNSDQVKFFSPFMLSNNYTINTNHSDYFWSMTFIVVASFSITILVLFFVLFYRKKFAQTTIYFYLCIYLLFYPLALGIRGPFREVFLLIWNNVPGFNIFRSIYKFQFVMYFIFVIILLIVLEKIKKRRYAKIIFLSLAIILGTNYILNPFRNRLTNPYKIPNYYFENEIKLRKEKLVNTYKVIPDKSIGNSRLYTSFDWNPNNWDSSNILKYFTNQNTAFVPFNANDVDDNIREQLCYKEFKKSKDISLVTKIASFLNIKHLIIQNDLRFNNISCLDHIEEYEGESIGKLNVYTIDSEFFLPHLYTSQNNILSQRRSDELSKILSQDDWKIRSAVFLKDQNYGKEKLLEAMKAPTSLKAYSPILEFGKINPTKYRVRVHGASGVFPMIFSESFHDGWKAYLAQTENLKADPSNQISKYKILDGNKEDQADLDELGDFIQKGWVTDLGGGEEKQIKHKRWDADKQKEELDYVEKYTIDFVSKNFQGTIQNDNLPEGHFWETWLQKPIENNENHLMANGYANSWVMDVNKICAATPGKCIKNADGTYDLEIIVEFWPQRLFYIGVGISGTTLLACLSYLMYNYGRKKYAKSQETIE